MRRDLVVVVVVVAAVLACCGVALAQAKDNPGVRRLDARAVALINRASGQTRAADATCALSFERTPPTLVDGGAGPQVSSVIAAFRRPATPAEQRVAATAVGEFFNPFFGTVGRDGGRIVHAADGAQVTLLSAQTTRQLGLPRPVYDRCQAATGQRLQVLLASQPAAVRRRTRAIFAQVTRNERPALDPPVLEGLDVMAAGASGGGPFEPKRFATHGMAGSSERHHAGQVSSQVTLLVPDGVTSVSLVFAGHVARGPGHADKQYPGTLRRQLLVRENVVDFHIARPAPDAFPTTMTWKGPTGNTLQVIHAGH